MKKLITAVFIATAVYTTAFVIAVFFGPQIADAAGHIGISNVVQQLRTQSVTYSLHAIPAAGATTDVTEGTNGVVSVLSINGLMEGDITDTDPDALPYPCKLGVDLVDTATVDTLECDCATIYGRNQFGTPISDVIGTCATDGAIAEGSPTRYEGARVFEIVNRVEVDDCDGSSDAGDSIRVVCDDDIGLPYHVTSEAAVISLCYHSGTDAAAGDTLCFEPADFTIDLDDESIEDIDGLTGVTPADGNTLTVRVRAPTGL